ncbi:hypothetical protein GHO27_04075 [Pseudomonas helleri]|uniref:Uncharacterized protein n=2 Tax=Pseudomonas helleri TaxID=1608996 RepID=A0A6L5HR79_9PSED|nr:hypothetical protein [Pseudomonas helleri]
MMSALRKAQFEHDEQLPPPVSETAQEVAREEWLYNAVEQLLLGCDVKFQRRMRKAQGVTVAELEAAVGEHAKDRLAVGEVVMPSLGRLLIENSGGRIGKAATAELLGSSNHPQGKLGEIAERLLRPLVNDALIAQAEDGVQ